MTCATSTTLGAYVDGRRTRTDCCRMSLVVPACPANVTVTSVSAGQAAAPGPRTCGVSRSVSCALLRVQTLRRRAFSHRPNFDGPHARHGTSRGDGDRLVAIRDVDEHVATEVLMRFRKRTVGHEPFAAAHPDAGGRRRRVQRGASQILPARRELVHELLLLAVDLLSYGQAELAPGLVQVN